jgi:hypothetical protein
MLPHSGNIFSDDQVLTTGSGTTLNAASTNIIDLQDTNYGEGNPLDVCIELPEAVVGGVAPTLTIKLEDDSAVGFGTVRTVLSTRAYAAADQVKGKLIKFGLPTPLRRYIRLYITLVPGAAAITAGKMNAWLARRDV